MNRKSTLLLILLASCVEPYPIRQQDYEQVLVVEGFFSNAVKQHKVVLSRTARIDMAERIPEQGAAVRILSASGEIIPLNETSPGNYLTSFTGGITGNQYRLQITTSSGRNYSSEPVTLKATPPVGTIYAKYFAESEELPLGIQVYLDTEDPSGNTRYYRWEYEDTYEIQTPYVSAFEWVGGNTVLFRAEPVNRCWVQDTSRNVITGTTQGLQLDKISALPLKFVSGETEALLVRYSILVKQYALSKEAFYFWKDLQAVNEKQGSLFDVQPGPIRGNITSGSDPNEMVLGYFDAATISEKRVFFTAEQFAMAGYVPPDFRSSCTENSLILVPALEIGDFMTKYQSVLEIYDVTSVPTPSYQLLPRHCCNCSNDGTPVKPTYWPD